MSNPLINPKPDSQRTRMVVEFLPYGDFDPSSDPDMNSFSGPAWNCIKYLNNSGPNPSHAICMISVDRSRDENKPSVCCLPQNNFSKVKHGCIAQVTAIATDNEGEQYTEVVYVGYVTNIKQDLGNDIATVTLSDFRHKLAALPCIGTFFATDSNDGDCDNDLKFLQSEHSICNPNSGPGGSLEPNCMLSSDYGIPVFCTPNYGYQNNPQSSNAIGTTPMRTRACWWTPQTLWQHFQWRFTSPDALELANHEVRPFNLPQIPKNLTWPTGLESNFTVSTTYPETSLRKTFTADYNGRDLNTILQMICQMYAIYGIAIDPIDGFEGQLNVVRVRSDDDTETGTDVIRYISTVARQTDPGVVDGEYTTDSSKTYSQLFLSGSEVVVEILIDLVNVWSDADYEKWYQDLFSNFVTGKLEFVLPQVNKANINVFNAYRPDPSVDIQIGTISNVSGLSEAGAPFSQRGRAALQKLLSSALPKGGDFTLTELTNYQYPIYIQRDENLDSTSYGGEGDPNWKTIADSDHIEIDKIDGLLYLDGLRSGQNTFYPDLHFVKTANDLAADYASYALRACLALPLDHCLTSWKQLQNDSMRPFNANNQNVSAVGGIIANNLDSSFLANEINRMFFMDFATDNEPGKGLYACNLANESAPNPLDPTDVRTTQILDDTPYLNTQSYIRCDDMFRLQRDGFLVFASILPGWSPGTLINNIVTVFEDGSISYYPINSVIQGVECTSGKAESTKLILGKS